MGTINVQSKQPKSEIDFDKMIKISRTQADFDLWYNFTLNENGDIWAIGGWNAPFSYIYKWSVDDAKWKPVKLPNVGGAVTSNIYFKDSQNGWLLSDYGVLTTKDGGSNWQIISLPKNSEVTKLESINFRNSEIGFIGGTTGYLARTNFEPVHGVEILCTNNGGKDFTICYKNKKVNTVQEIINLKQDISVILVDGSKILTTDNAGKNWSAKELPISANAITVDNKDTLWILEKTGKIFYSDDVGNSWKESNINNTNLKTDWNSIAFSENGVGMAVAYGGLLAISKDGQSWQISKPDKMSEDLYSVQIRDSYIVIQGKDNFYLLKLQND
jgi:photosystem II stability/assembly factor-like uncharacterized protein